MSTLSPAFGSANYDHNNDHDDADAAERLRRSGGSRQARKLQLRNAGFRGGTIATRKLTPKSIPSSTWSAGGEYEASSGTENVPPLMQDVRTPGSNRRVSSGILQDIGNGTITRRKRTNPRISSAKWSDSDGSPAEKPYATTPFSRVQSNGTVRQRSVKTRPKVAHKRRSVSSETSKYIEHLEAELAASQSQLSRINSPTVTRQQSTKMRTMDAETRVLQKEVEDWETQYEKRVQEEVDRHAEVETNLRGRLRTLEQDYEETQFRMRELETQVAAATQSMEAAEAANVNLERRIEIMSELLAASPSKIDLHAETPGRSRKHARPKSMLPRFPTASSLLGSPERHPQTQPPSPLLSFTNYSPEVTASPVQSVCRLDISSQQSDYMSEAESVFSEASVAGDSMTSAENFEGPSNHNPWMLPPPLPHHRSKPARRMRRFGAGSMGPKPLILPSTSRCDQFPTASAPGLERSETTPAFFPNPALSSHGSHSPLLGRRRASTMANGETLAALDPSPFSPDEPLQDCGEDTLMSFHTSSSPSSRPVTRDLSSLGSMRGRNLMEELSTAWIKDSDASSQLLVEGQDISSSRPSSSAAPDVPSALGEDTTLIHGTLTHAHDIPVLEHRAASASTALVRPRRRRASSPNLSAPAIYSASIFERLHFLFSDLWRSPVDLARHFVRTAQACIRIPRTLLNFQYWLVGALLGPLARRRALEDITHPNYTEESSSLLESSPDTPTEDSNLAYGTLQPSPARKSPNPSSALRKKRATHKLRCPHRRRAKHSPLLWIKFSVTLAVAVGAAFKDGPGSLLERGGCTCQVERRLERRRSTGVDGGGLV
ncbi:uncharacterized protein LTR77_008736 [Saxophila tyrrhenica]|uniref:Uncharacterized protein n=1 Tax=Saxophila tyrrhenica TaxID=1690608 RepID=A0AAV9P3E9_9PEZI|nr:hypothetical protein LTR77_008736 [Saxophila tyrrhenica]